MTTHEKPDLLKIKEEIKKGKTLVEISRKFKVSVSSIRHFLKKEGVDYRVIMIARREKHSKEEFDECLSFAREYNRVPTYKEFEKLGIPHSRIGFYIHKLKEKGFKQQSLSPLRINDEDLLKELNHIYKKTGELPRKKTVVEHSRYSKDTYINHFGSLHKAIKQMQIHYHVEQ